MHVHMHGWVHPSKLNTNKCSYMKAGSPFLFRRNPKISKKVTIDFVTSFQLSVLTYSMEQSPSWEANWFSASQKISSILWKPKVNYLIHKCPLPVPILSQLNPVHTPTCHFLKIRLYIILPSKPGSPKCSLSLSFPHQNPVYASPRPYALHAPPISFFSTNCPSGLPNRISRPPPEGFL